MKAPHNVNRSSITKERLSMNSVQSLSHTKWECKYHVTWIPKYRKKQIYKELRKHLGEVLRDLARRKECKIVEGHLMPDHAHILISIPPKYAVSQIIGFIKGKRRNFTGQHFWARGYHVSTVGKDEEAIRNYIRSQEKEDQRIEQLNSFK